MEIKTIVEELNRVFKEENIDLVLNPNDFECGFIENVPHSEVIRPTKKEQRQTQEETGIALPQPVRSKRSDASSENSNNQTHYVISGAEYFDFLTQGGGSDSPFKYRYPFYLYPENLRLLLNNVPNGYYPQEIKDYLVQNFIETKQTYQASIGAIATTQGRMMLASKEMVLDDEAGEFFNKCRYAQFEDDYLVILKHEEKFAYSMLFIPAPIVEKYNLSYSTLKNSLIGKISKTYVDLFSTVEVVGAKNLLVFGAPGTGKSHWVKEMFEDSTDTIRVTFHEEYSYQDFIGALKPTVHNGNISYQFNAGPFTRILTKAIGNKQKHHTLIIEEMNRANAAAVFGDIFQLLDRNELGISKYGIEQLDIAQYISKKLNTTIDSTICLPSNLSIVATMNSADQGVFVLDTAFKRRWQFKYIPIEFDAWHEETKIDYIKVDGRVYQISVRYFIEQLNDYLSGMETLEINEDRLIGPYFIEKEKWAKWLKGDVFQKLLNYLWDDVARINRSEVFLEKYNQFSKLCTDFKDLEIVFTEPLNSLILMGATIKEEHYD